MKTLKKYLGLYGAFFRASFIGDLEYRANFAVRIVSDVLWYVAQIVTFEVLYGHTKKIGDWTLPQTKVFLGILFVVDALYMIILSANFDGFSDKVRKGELDMILAKPINSQFMVSLQRVSTAMLGNLVIAFAWLFYALAMLPDFSWWRLLWLTFLIPSSMFAFYGFRFAMAATAVIFTRSENLQFIWFSLYRLGMRPDSIYVPWLKLILMSVLPMAMIASVPARALLDPPELLLFLWAPVLAALTLWLSTKFWKLCLKQYSSASS